MADLLGTRQKRLTASETDVLVRAVKDGEVTCMRMGETHPNQRRLNRRGRKKDACFYVFMDTFLARVVHPLHYGQPCALKIAL